MNFFYHYNTNYYGMTFHLHIFYKYTKVISSSGNLRSTVIVGERGNFMHEFYYLYTFDYFKFDKDIWSKFHYTVISVMCNNNFVCRMENYKEFIKEMYNLYINYKNNNGLFNCYNTYGNNNIEQLINMIYNNSDDTIFDGITQDEILKKSEEMITYIHDLITYNKNINKIIKYLYNLFLYNTCDENIN